MSMSFLSSELVVELAVNRPHCALQLHIEASLAFDRVFVFPEWRVNLRDSFATVLVYDSLACLADSLWLVHRLVFLSYQLLLVFLRRKSIVAH